MNTTVFSQIAGALETAAPTLASMFGGPLAGTAVTALEGVLGLKPGAGASAVAAALQTASMTPEQMVALRQADDDLKIKLGQQGIDLAKINADFQTHMVDDDVADRSSARLRESNVHDSTPKVLAAVVTIGFFGILLSMMFCEIQPSAKEPILLLLGALTTAWVGVITYYFGSSSGAARGQELLAQSGPVPGNKPIELTSK